MNFSVAVGPSAEARAVSQGSGISSCFPAKHLKCRGKSAAHSLPTRNNAPRPAALAAKISACQPSATAAATPATNAPNLHPRTRRTFTSHCSLLSNDSTVAQPKHQ
ncbi:hypothetical protein DIS24_g10046 [Lasiodiplodia hormozganensis]|uniref:Uncharacterized protein n=1 Tax=Lasiodiplodia hormozganensis TaxID=869390 RepID=A0AA39XRR8_9PEZI|nr:hypothetical protein DIS24_g10046 [Lasiodiplodia hormozganensis]